MDIVDEARKYRSALARQVDEHPRRSAGVALGLGFVLGGGLSSRIVARALGAGARIGFRMAVVPFVAQAVISWAEAFLTAPAARALTLNAPVRPEIKRRRPKNETHRPQ